jgi:hypothetical protein
MNKPEEYNPYGEFSEAEVFVLKFREFLERLYASKFRHTVMITGDWEDVRCIFLDLGLIVTLAATSLDNDALEWTDPNFGITSLPEEVQDLFEHAEMY